MKARKAMAVIGAASKGKIGIKSAKGAVRHPRLLLLGAKAARPAGRFGFKAGKPVAKRQLRQRAARLGETARSIGEATRSIGETLPISVPQLAYELGLVQPPKRKRTAPRVAVGIVIGASAMYFLEPEHGRERRERVAQMVS
jgi:hypothetical protein